VVRWRVIGFFAGSVVARVALGASVAVRLPRVKKAVRAPVLDRLWLPRLLLLWWWLLLLVVVVLRLLTVSSGRRGCGKRGGRQV
jgi:hypothetical protein